MLKYPFQCHLKEYLIISVYCDVQRSKTFPCVVSVRHLTSEDCCGFSTNAKRKHTMVRLKLYISHPKGKDNKTWQKHLPLVLEALNCIMGMLKLGVTSVF